MNFLGFTKTSEDNNLSLNMLSQDLVNVLKAAYGDNVIESRDIFLIGHRYVNLISRRFVKYDNFKFIFYYLILVWEGVLLQTQLQKDQFHP